jgi:hypothetical protein
MEGKLLLTTPAKKFECQGEQEYERRGYRLQFHHLLPGITGLAQPCEGLPDSPVSLG